MIYLKSHNLQKQDSKFPSTSKLQEGRHCLFSDVYSVYSSGWHLAIMPEHFAEKVNE